MIAAAIACVVAWQRPPPPAPPSAATLAEARLAEASGLSLRPASPFGPAPTGAQPAPDEAPPTPVPDPPPAGMTPSQWHDLQDALKDHPGHVAELRRVAAYMAFKDRLARLQAAREQASEGPELQALAQQLDADLPTHLAQGDLSPAEAHALKGAVLQALEPDTDRRFERLAQWAQAQPQNPAVATNPRQEQHTQRQAALLAAWQALPPAQRDPRQLQADLEALRLRPAAR
jgi:hypothetical protein